MRKLRFLVGVIFCCFVLASCNNSNNSGGDEPEKELELRELEVIDNNNDVIYLGETFTGEGYDVNLVYRVINGAGEKVKVECTNYVIDDSAVDYETIGTYQVVFIARVKNKVFKKPVNIRIADSRLIELKINHLYGIKAEDYTGANIKVGQSDLSGVDTVVYLIYTEGHYENGELVTTEVRKRSGYELDKSNVDVTKPGEYPVYVSFKESYNVDGETIEVVVKTFFLVTVEN